MSTSTNIGLLGVKKMTLELRRSQGAVLTQLEEAFIHAVKNALDIQGQIGEAANQGLPQIVIADMNAALDYMTLAAANLASLIPI